MNFVVISYAKNPARHDVLDKVRIKKRVKTLKIYPKQRYIPHRNIFQILSK